MEEITVSEEIKDPNIEEVVCKNEQPTEGDKSGKTVDYICRLLLVVFALVLWFAAPFLKFEYDGERTAFTIMDTVAEHVDDFEFPDVINGGLYSQSFYLLCIAGIPFIGLMISLFLNLGAKYKAARCLMRIVAVCMAISIVYIVSEGSWEAICFGYLGILILSAAMSFVSVDD